MKSRSGNRTAQKGFTLVELLVVVVVISILAVIGYVVYSGMQTRAHKAILSSDLTASAEILNLDKTRSGGTAYPADIDDADKGNGLPASSGTNYQYTVSNTSPPTFCLTATNSSISMYITESTPPQDGACVGHSG